MGVSAGRRKKMLKAADFLGKKASPGDSGSRVVITGKGGVGKTTITALLSKLFAADGSRVLAVDEDPQQNLAYSLGFPEEDTEKLVPLSRNFDYIEEKVGSRPGEGWGQLLTLNPDVSDVVERFGISIEERIDLLVMGSVVQAATGCLCPENALLESVIRYIRLRDGEVILMDTQAGVEHFGRALAGGFGQALVVSEPGFNALQVALHAAGLAGELGIPVVNLVVNRVRHDQDKEKVEEMLKKNNPFNSVFYLPFDGDVPDHEPDVTPLLSSGGAFMEGVNSVYRAVKGGF